MGTTNVPSRLWGARVAIFFAGIMLSFIGAASIARADGVVTDCSNDVQLSSLLAGGGLITFNCGGIHAPATIPLSSVVFPVSGTTIDGSNGGNTIVLDGQGNTRLIQVNVGTQAVLTNLALTHGAAVSGSCLITFGTVELDNVEVHGCNSGGTTENGGALYVDSGASATLNNVNLHDNSAGLSGGGIYNLGTLTVNNSTFTHNSAATGDGGGIRNAGLLTVTQGTLSGNTAATGGGGISSSGATAKVTLSNVDLTSNSALSGNGGAIENITGTLKLTNGTVSGNTVAGSFSGLGGGIHNLAGDLRLQNVIVSSNVITAGSGGGIANDIDPSFLGLTNVTLNANRARSGGGLLNYGLINATSVSINGNTSTGAGGGILSSGQLIMDNAIIYDNTAVSVGGGLLNSGSAFLNFMTISTNSSTASGNIAGGGGIFNYNQLYMTNATISGNNATADGGGIYNWALDASHIGKGNLTNVTIENNRAGRSGGGVFNYLSVFANTVTLKNSMVGDSPSGANCGGAALTTPSADKYSLSSDLTCGLGGNGSQNNIPVRLNPLAFNGGPSVGATGLSAPLLTHLPQLSSPAIDGVSGSDFPLTDERGILRPFGAGGDIGAVEWTPSKLYLPLIVR